MLEEQVCNFFNGLYCTVRAHLCDEDAWLWVRPPLKILKTIKLTKYA